MPPCRQTRTSKAASSRAAAHRPSNWASLTPVRADGLAQAPDDAAEFPAMTAPLPMSPPLSIWGGRQESFFDISTQVLRAPVRRANVT